MCLPTPPSWPEVPFFLFLIMMDVKLLSSYPKQMQTLFVFTFHLTVIHDSEVYK